MSNDLWSNDLIQFARLLCELNATQDKLDLREVAKSTGLEVSDVSAILDRAHDAWERFKKSDGLTWTPDGLDVKLVDTQENGMWVGIETPCGSVSVKVNHVQDGVIVDVWGDPDDDSPIASTCVDHSAIEESYDRGKTTRETTWRCDFLLMHSDGTWTTEVFDVPNKYYQASSDVLEAWWSDVYSNDHVYATVQFVHVYYRYAGVENDR